MERLTYKGKNGKVYVKGDGYYNGVRLRLDEIASRLAAYEDTGLEPEEIRAIHAFFNDRSMVDFEHLVLLLEAEAKGLLVVLPCKVGDTVYSKDGKAAEVEEFCADKFRVTAMVSFGCDYDCKDCSFNSWHTEYSGENSCDGEYGMALVPDEQFGKTVFLTREEAEAALQRQNSRMKRDECEQM